MVNFDPEKPKSRKRERLEDKIITFVAIGGLAAAAWAYGHNRNAHEGSESVDPDRAVPVYNQHQLGGIEYAPHSKLTSAQKDMLEKMGVKKVGPVAGQK